MFLIETVFKICIRVGHIPRKHSKNMLHKRFGFHTLLCRISLIKLCSIFCINRKYNENDGENTIDDLCKETKLHIKWRGTGGREPGRMGAGGGREAGGDRAGCGSHVRAGGGRRMGDIKFFNDFLVPF